MQSKLREIPVDSYTGSNRDETISLQIRQQQQVIDEATESINRFEKEAPQSPHDAPSQSRGRGFIELNNDAILQGNTAQGIQFGEQQEGTRGNQVTPQQQKPASRINAPQIKGGRIENQPAGSSKLRRKGKAVPQRRSLDRKSLLEENRRQNSFFYNDSSNQEPNNKANFGLQSRNGDLDDFSGNGNVVPGFKLDKDRDGTNNQQAFPNEAANTGAAELPSLITANEPISDGKWTTTGGLSLPIELPSYEQSIVFSKVEGKPELVIEVYSRDLINKLLGIAWAVVSAIVLLWLLGSMKKFASGENLPKLYLLLILSGLASFALLPNPLSWFGLLVAVFAGTLYALASTRKYVQRRPETPVHS